MNPARPKVPDLVPLLEAVYARPSGAAGCCLHVLTDDGNWGSAAFCLEWARKAGHPECIAAAEMAVHMSESQIARATRRARI